MMENSWGTPGSKVEAIDLLRLRESETESKKRVKARNKGQETSHSDQE